MVLGETLDKSEQVSDWAAPTLSASQLTYALNDPIVTHRIWEALRAELHRKSRQHGVDIVAGYEDMRFSAAMAHRMERAGIGFDVAAHQAWIARKQEPVTAIEAHLAGCRSGALSCLHRFRRAARPVVPAASRILRRSRIGGRRCWGGQKRRRPGGYRSVVRTSPRFSLPIVCSLPSGDWSRRSMRGPSRCAVWRRSARRSPVTSSTGGCMVSCMPAVRSPGVTPVPIRTCRTSRPTRNSVVSSVLPRVALFVDVDYSQLELRVFAALSGDAKMIAAFEDGWDYHDLIMQRLGCTRRQAKAINFGIIFGMGVATLAAELGVDDVTAGEYLRGWDEQAPTGAEWRSSLPRLYVAEQGVRTARRWIDYLDDDDADAAANTRPMNYPVQGGAADVMHRAMRLLFERYRDWPGDVLPVLTVHDEVLVEVDIAVADQVGSLLADVMVEAFRDVLPNGPTRFLAIPGVGPTWAAAKADGEMREKALRQALP